MSSNTLQTSLLSADVPDSECSQYSLRSPSPSQLFIKQRWRTRSDICFDVATYSIAVSLAITSFLTLLDWIVFTITHAFLLPQLMYNLCSVYFAVVFIFSDLLFVYFVDEVQTSSLHHRSKLSSLQSIRYAMQNPIQTLHSTSMEELVLLVAIFASYIMRCTQYQSVIAVDTFVIVRDLGVSIGRFLLFLHINDYYGVRPYMLALSFLFYLLREITDFLYHITIDDDHVNDIKSEISLFVIVLNFTTVFYLFHKILCRLLYPNVNVYKNAILQFEDNRLNIDVFTNGFGGVRDTSLWCVDASSFKRAVCRYLNICMALFTLLIAISLLYFSIDPQHRKSVYYYSLLNVFCVLFIVQSHCMTFVRTGQHQTFSAFQIWNILFYLSVFRFFSLDRDVWFVWVNVLNTLLFFNLVLFIGELNHYKLDWISRLRLSAWFVMCARYYYEGLSGLQDTLYAEHENGWTLLLWNFGLFFEQNVYFTCMKLIAFKFIWWNKDQFRYQSIFEYQREKRRETNNFGVQIEIAWQREPNTNQTP